jgi:hypothetical protein
MVADTTLIIHILVTAPQLQPAGNRGAADSPRVRGRPAAVPLRREDTRRGLHRPGPVIHKILDHIGRRFDPLKLPGRAPPLGDNFFPDPFPDYGPQ